MRLSSIHPRKSRRLRSCYPRSQKRDLHPKDEDLSLGTPDWDTRSCYDSERSKSYLIARLGYRPAGLAGEGRSIWMAWR
jgi:hypothetical protein